MYIILFRRTLMYITFRILFLYCKALHRLIIYRIPKRRNMFSLSLHPLLTSSRLFLPSFFSPSLSTFFPSSSSISVFLSVCLSLRFSLSQKNLINSYIMGRCFSKQVTLKQKVLLKCRFWFNRVWRFFNSKTFPSDAYITGLSTKDP